MHGAREAPGPSGLPVAGVPRRLLKEMEVAVTHAVDSVLEKHAPTSPPQHSQQEQKGGPQQHAHPHPARKRTNVRDASCYPHALQPSIGLRLNRINIKPEPTKSGKLV